MREWKEDGQGQKKEMKIRKWGGRGKGQEKGLV